jgi:transposase
MGTPKIFLDKFKAAVVKKLLNRGSQSISEFCRENNLALSSVTKWRRDCANAPGMKNKASGSKLSAESILKIISETYSLHEEELGLYLRKNGLHAEQLAEWRSSFLSSVMQPKVSTNKKDERDAKIKELERNLRKKDAALAEASALLILQKKIQLIWPMPKEDEE